VIAATHRDLHQAVQQQRFREDLYYRLGVVPIALPQLCQRLADIVPLAEHFLVLAARGAPPRRLASDAAARLLSYPWPGNVRELRNAMERVTTLVRRPVIVAADLDFLESVGQRRPGIANLLTGTLPEVVARVEIEMIQRALAGSSGNRAQAAERLGIRRQLLYRKLARYGFELSLNETDGVPEADTDELYHPSDLSDSR
jgi:DNA-binding NtrC family response regulator